MLQGLLFTKCLTSDLVNTTIPILYDHLVYIMRFYVDGIEQDVQDPKFYMDEEKFNDIKESISEVLEKNANNLVDFWYDELLC